MGAPNHCGAAEKSKNVTSAFFNAVHFLSHDLSFEHVGAKLASFPRAPSNSLRPWPYGFVLILLLQVKTPYTAHASHETTNLSWLMKSATNSKMRSLLARSGVSKLRPAKKFVIDER